MNLHAIARPMVNAVNPSVLGTWLASDGSTTEPSGKRVPKYVTKSDVPMQVQSLGSKEIEHLDSLNIQNVTRGVYLYGAPRAVDRVAGAGGDLLKFSGRTWLVVAVLETWDQSGWSKVAVTEQLDAA